MKKLTKQEPTRYKMSRFEDEELKLTDTVKRKESIVKSSVKSSEKFKLIELQTATGNFHLLSNKLVDDNDSTTSAKNAQHCFGGCLHTAQCLYRMRDIQSKEKVVN